MAGRREAHRCWWLRGRWDVWRRGSAPLLLREGAREGWVEGEKNSICDGKPALVRHWPGIRVKVELARRKGVQGSV